MGAYSTWSTSSLVRTKDELNRKLDNAEGMVCERINWINALKAIERELAARMKPAAAPTDTYSPEIIAFEDASGWKYN